MWVGGVPTLPAAGQPARIAQLDPPVRGGGVEAGAGRRSGRHSLRVHLGVVGGGRAELGAAEARRPQLRGAHRGQPLWGWPGCRSARARGPRSMASAAPPFPARPGAPAGTCGLSSPRRSHRLRMARRPGRAGPSSPGPQPSRAALEIAAWRLPGAAGGGGCGRAVGLPRPWGASDLRGLPRPRSFSPWGPGALREVSLGCPRARQSAMHSDGGGKSIAPTPSRLDLKS